MRFLAPTAVFILTSHAFRLHACGIVATTPRPPIGALVPALPPRCSFVCRTFLAKGRVTIPLEASGKLVRLLEVSDSILTGVLTETL